MEREAAAGLPALTEEPWTVDDFWGITSVVFKVYVAPYSGVYGHHKLDLVD